MKNPKKVITLVSNKEEALRVQEEDFLKNHFINNGRLVCEMDRSYYSILLMPEIQNMLRINLDLGLFEVPKYLTDILVPRDTEWYMSKARDWDVFSCIIVTDTTVRIYELTKVYINDIIVGGDIVKTKIVELDFNDFNILIIYNDLDTGVAQWKITNTKIEFSTDLDEVTSQEALNTFNRTK